MELYAKVNLLLSFSTVIISLIALINTIENSKREEFNRKKEMEANYYSYPIIENGEKIEISIPINSKSIILGNIDSYNLLNLYVIKKDC